MKSGNSWRNKLPLILLTLALVGMFALGSLFVFGAQVIQAGRLDKSQNVPIVLFLLLLSAASIFSALVIIFRNLRSSQQSLTQAYGPGDDSFSEGELIDREAEAVRTNSPGLALQKTDVQIDALSKERTMLTAVLKRMTDGVLIADENGHVELINAAAARLFSVNEQEVLGRSIVELMRHQALVDLWSQSHEGDAQAITLEIGAAHKFLQVYATTLGSNLPGRTMLLFQDLTQIHHLETIRRDFISNVSHELRTPMASLKAISDTLLDGALDDPPAARRFVVRMDTEVDNLVLLVNELLELSRIESGRINLEFQRMEPCELMRKPFERMLLQAERAGVNMQMECPEGLPIVFADANRVSQIFINLMHNAIKFTPPGGHIQLDAWVHDKMLVFMVRDNGVGVAAKDQTRIFERFFKADRARTGGGTGLGLSISKHMVEAQGGYMWVESEEGSGSTFFFTLPVASN